MEFGNKIASLRAEHNMSQEELAGRLFVSRELISKWEMNKRRPDRKCVMKLSQIFSVDASYFESEFDALTRELSKCMPKGTEISQEEFSMLLNTFLEELSEKDRNIFVRRYYFLETPAQIAGEYVMSTVNVRVVLSRTRSKFSNFLKERKC